MSKEEERVMNGEILESHDGRGGAFTMLVPLQMPPGVHGMDLGSALLAQARYWGYRRAINAYRQAVEDEISTAQAVTNLYRAVEDLEAQKIIFGHKDERDEIATLGIKSRLDEHRARRNEAQKKLTQSSLDLQALTEAAEQRTAVNAINRKIELYNLEMEEARAERVRNEELRLLKEEREGTTESPFQKKLKKMQAAKSEYDEMVAAKADFVKEYGGEDNLPEYLKAMFEDFEDSLGFREK